MMMFTVTEGLSDMSS